MQQKILAALQKFWRGFLAFTPGQKVVTGAAVLALVIGGFLFSSWASKPSYAPLFTNLAPADASGIIDKLNANKTPYQLAANGTEIMVPSKDVYSLRLTMSAAGLPSSTTSGYSLLDQEGITTSDFKQHVDYQRAIEGELDKTLESINGVQNAAVHLAIPAATVFDDGTDKPTASVLLTTEPGTTLSANQVQSVVNLVSSSVPSLTADQVSVSDSTGKVLSAAGTDGGDQASADSRTAAMALYDKQQDATVQAMLDKLVGVGNSVVTVNADLDYDKKISNSVSYSAASGVPPLSQSGSTESYGASAGKSGAVLGSVASNPVSSASPAASGAGPYVSKNNMQDNAVNAISESASAAPGAVRKLDVAVLLDKNAGPINVAAVEKLVSSAVGYNAARGDTLSVQAQPFNTAQATAAAAASAAAAKAAAAAKSKAAFMSLLKTGAIVLLILAIVIATFIMNRKRKKNEDLPDDLDTFLSTLNDSPGSLPPAPRDIVPPQSREAAITAARKRDLAEMADAQPQEVARLLRGWLNTKES